MAVATIVMSRAQRNMDNSNATVIMKSGKAEGKSEVSMRDSSRVRESAGTPPSSLSTISFSVRATSSLDCGRGVGLERSEEEVEAVEEAEVVAAMVGLSCLQTAISKSVIEILAI